MQLLAQARDGLPAEACTLGQQPRASTSSSSGPSSRAGSGAQHAASAAQLQQQQHAAEWRRVLGQVQQELLTVVELLGHWRHHNAFCSFEPLLVVSG
jgi:hypothetical protein